MIDIHLHTRFSFDSNEEPQNYLNKAKNIGIKTIGFSEHYDYDAILDGETDVSLTSLNEYFENCKKLELSNQSINILKGIEFGYRKSCVSHYKELLDLHPFDYIINSVHTIQGRGDCFHDKFFSGRPLSDCYLEYLKCVLESVYADYDYQIIGHLGYVCRYRQSEQKLIYKDYKDIIDEILSAIISRDKCLEINTSSGTSGCSFLPNEDVIKRYIQLGGKLISFGSDAHLAEAYMRKADQLKAFLKRLGIGELYYFKERKPVAYKI